MADANILLIVLPLLYYNSSLFHIFSQINQINKSQQMANKIGIKCLTITMNTIAVFDMIFFLSYFKIILIHNID